MGFTVTRQIGIDAGHRIASHGSKCRHLHGHRYLIEACCSTSSGDLRADGEQAGMVLDFGFLKEEMMAHIDAPCDHGLILDLADHQVLSLFAPPEASPADWLGHLAAQIRDRGYVQTNDTALGQKLYVIPFPPTAEWLARHWYERLAPAVAARSDGLAVLDRVTVWETPNCYATYTAG
ncbi:6-carboxytetrahydropterin synthase [Skermanella pratensis]|uniref:6-carboxytetrahydropterin synthase n=1 Tax=Skermanella pratensis TaxID=2233999 RepID=UPI001300D0E9|nr:6-carboxytetrahydropterin synthase [Skermanella pratensis]